MIPLKEPGGTRPPLDELMAGVAEQGALQTEKLKAKLADARAKGDVNSILYYERAVADAEAAAAMAAKMSTSFGAIFGPQGGA